MYFILERKFKDMLDPKLQKQNYVNSTVLT